jgi:hypothetical protein
MPLARDLDRPPPLELDNARVLVRGISIEQKTPISDA